MSRYQNKVVVITGSSQGIGRELALRLGQQGASIVLNARNAEKLAAVAQELTQQGVAVLTIPGDVTQPEDCVALIRQTVDHYGRLDILVNNAGVSMRGRVEELDHAVVNSMFQINTIAPFTLTKLAMPHLRQSKGQVAFVSSLAGLRGLPQLSAYCSAKMALTALAESLRIEHHGEGIHVGLVFVGQTEIEADKTAVGPDGQPVPLGERKGALMSSIPEVATGIDRNLRRRKKVSYIGLPAKIYWRLMRYFPRLSEVLVRRQAAKMEDNLK